jgi:hypothetical protein
LLIQITTTFLQQTKTYHDEKESTSKSTLKTMPMSPPTGGRRVPRGFKPYDCTKDEEIEALKLVFQVDTGVY